MSSPASAFDFIGVGSPIMDLLAPVPESFLATVRGDKGGMVLVDDAEMQSIVTRLPAPPAAATGGSAANTTFNVARLGLRTAFLGKLGNDDNAHIYRERFAAVGVDGSRFKQAAQSNARCLSLVTPDAQRATNRVTTKISAAIVRLIARSPAMSASLARMAASTVRRFSPTATAWVRVSCKADMPWV